MYKRKQTTHKNQVFSISCTCTWYCKAYYNIIWAWVAWFKTTFHECVQSSFVHVFSKYMLVYFILVVKHWSICVMNRKYGLCVEGGVLFNIWPCRYYKLDWIQGPLWSWSWSYGSWIYNLPVQSGPITTKVVSSNPVHDEVYSLQHCDKVCQWLATGHWFSLVIPVSSINKTDCQDITEILLKVALNTIKSNKMIDSKLYINKEVDNTISDTVIL